MNRLDPFTYAFADLAESRFATVRREAAARGTGAGHRASFAALPAVQRILAEIETPELIAAAPQAAAEYLHTLYVAFLFWDAGRRVVALERSALDGALGGDPPRVLPPVPSGACYVQLPERWFWARVGPDDPPEPLDGVFVVSSGDGREITAVAVLGLRPDRDGFSQIAVTATPAEVLEARAASRTPPFASVLEGGDRAGVRSLVTTGELLHLVQLALAVAAG